VDCVVASSTVVRESLRAIGVTTRIEVIPNGVDTRTFAPPASPQARRAVAEQLGLDPDAEIVLYVGGLIPRKGIDVLVEAWAKIARCRPRAFLVLVGPDPQQLWGEGESSGFLAQIRASLAASGAKERVVFTGLRDNVAPYYQAADVFAFPSRREGMGNVVLEAMSSGVPCVLAPFAGLPDDFGHPGEQYLLVERTPDAFADAICTLLDDPDRHMQFGHQARQWAEEQLGVAHSLDKYAALYRELVGRARAGTLRA
jgi:glycosyltransferase involved in cell wall biosynthesis